MNRGIKFREKRIENRVCDTEEFYRNWNEIYKQELSERNKKARQVLAKIRNIKETDISNMYEIDILDEIEKEYMKLKKGTKENE